MADKLAYRIRIGGQTASSKSAENERLLMSLDVVLGMGGGGGCQILLGDPMHAAPDPGDALSVELDAGDGAVRVFTGEVASVRIDATGMRVVAFDAVAKLANLQAEGSYEDVDAGFVVKDLLQQAGAKAGEVAQGVKLASHVVTASPDALRQLLTLAGWCGADLYCDGEGKVHFTTPAEKGAQHPFRFASNVLRLELAATPPLYDSVVVYGEGAAASQGASKFYWLATDMAGVSGKAALDAHGAVVAGKVGDHPRSLKLGAVRSGEAAQAVAEAQMRALAARWLRGRLEVFGTPKVIPGDLVKIEDIPSGHAAFKLLAGGHTPRVRKVRHLLSRNGGFLTHLEF